MAKMFNVLIIEIFKTYKISLNFCLQLAFIIDSEIL